MRYKLVKSNEEVCDYVIDKITDKYTDVTRGEVFTNKEGFLEEIGEYIWEMPNNVEVKLYMRFLIWFYYLLYLLIVLTTPIRFVLFGIGRLKYNSLLSRFMVEFAYRIDKQFKYISIRKSHSYIHISDYTIEDRYSWLDENIEECLMTDSYKEIKSKTKLRYRIFSPIVVPIAFASILLCRFIGLITGLDLPNGKIQKFFNFIGKEFAGE